MKKKQNRRIKNKKVTSYKKENDFMTTYILPVRRYVIVALLIAFVIRIFITLNSGVLVAMAKVGGYDWVIAVVIAAVYGFLEYKHHKNVTLKSVIIYSVVMGILFGCIVAIVDMIIIRDLWAVSNIIKKPIIIALLFGAVSTIGFVFHKNGN